MALDGLHNAVFDIDNGIGLDNAIERERAKKQAKVDQKDLDFFEADHDDPDYELTKENITGTRKVKEWKMPNRQHI